jgi:alkanesulfonate monooxygenase SsuD/methylene tetrahydromethanopterin reductase-like flavin-dependent oxidoreductase (luciferase family)
VAETDAEAERVGGAMFRSMYEYRESVQNHYQKLKGVSITSPKGQSARLDINHSLICGSPATVAEILKRHDECGIGGVLMTFKMGPMPYDVAAQSIELFMKKVAPQVRAAARQPAVA